MLNSHVIKDLSDGLIDDVLDSLGFMVKRGHRRQNMGSHVGRLGHEPQMPFVQRCFPYDQDQFALFLQRNIRSLGQ